jgi:hypothetical protein
MSDETKTRDYFRSKLLGTPKRRRSELIKLDVDGEIVEVEIRAPSLKDDGEISRRSTKLITKRGAREPEVEFNLTEAHVYSAILCAYIPGTEQRMFEPADADALRNAPVGSWLETICKRAHSIRSADPEEVAKNSEATPAD